MTKIVKKLDCCKMNCPKPIIELTKAINKLKCDDIIEMLVDDLETKNDLPKWCIIKNCQIIEKKDLPKGVSKYLIKKCNN